MVVTRSKVQAMDSEHTIAAKIQRSQQCWCVPLSGNCASAATSQMLLLHVLGLAQVLSAAQLLEVQTAHVSASALSATIFAKPHITTRWQMGSAS
jgi:hypothetical protein